MNAGNLLEVCRQLRDKLPDTVRIIVAADDDRNTQGNPGLAMAFLAAEHVGAEVIRPELPCSDCECTDFNDLTACPDAPKRDSGTGLDSTDQGPIPLQTTLPPVEPLVAAMLPESFVGFVTSTSEQMQAPIDYLAVSTMVTAAGAVGASVEIHPKQHDSWRVVPVLWGALIGPPSAMKSPCLSAATRAARDIEDDLREQHKTEMMLYDMDQELAEAKQKEAREKAKKLITTDREQARAILQASGGDIEEPVPQRLIINDATVEKVGEIMGQNPDGLLLIRDELSGFVAKLNDEDAQSARAFYLECFDGQNPFTYDRIGRGTIHIKRCVMSILGGIQPSKIAQIVERALHGQTDDGFLQRFQLPVWPDQPKNWKYVDIAGDDEAYQRYADVIRALHNIRHRDADSPALTLRFSEEAQVLFRHWYEHIQIRARGDDVHPVMQAFMLKLPKTIASFALLFELIDGGREHVGVPAIERALLWAPYLESHANRLYSAANTRAISGAKLILARRGKLPGIFTAREIIRNSWTGLTTKGAVTAALELLVDHRYLIVIPTPHSTTGGRPTTRYRWRESDSREG